ncbi:MAG TPA: helix-turn-helix domain-containing protein [Terriglobia bacterium]|nr:helix-turn-helix domain-containing protein [Terriglobia bacterium]
MRIQFADKFVADLETGELFKNGRLRRLQDKPFRLLELLLARPARLATYSDIERRLWPGLNVDARHGIKEAAQKVRQALGADAHRLQCLRGRGYRLMVSALALPEEMLSAPLQTANTGGIYAPIPPAFTDQPCDQATA